MTKQKLINLALQGGGSHGAYTWGVLDRLLEEKDLIINAASGSSAGAMNAAVLADGYRKRKAEGAKEALYNFWEKVSEVGVFTNPVHLNPAEQFQNGWNIDNSVSYQWFDMLTRMYSPYQLNPFNLNPLRGLLESMIDFENINDGGDIPLFITATSVKSGQPRVFRCHEISVDVLLASACIPFYFQTVNVDGEPYWDGGYMGNPSIWPLIYKTKISDILLVQINPLYREEVPQSAQEIINRMNEITFNSSLIAEMRAINFVSKLIHDNNLDRKKYKDVHMHMIPAPDITYGLNASSKMNTDWRFFTFLRDIGREKAELWIKHHKKDVGIKNTVDIEETFLTKTPTIKKEMKKKKA